MFPPTDTPPPRLPLAAAKAAGVVLAEEFKAPFGFYDAASGLPVPTGRDPDAGGPSPSAAVAFAAAGLSRVTPLGSGHYELQFVIVDGQQPVLVARGVVKGLGVAEADRPREQEWLTRWLAAVADRLRFGDQFAAYRRAADDQAAQASRAWTVVLGVDDAVRRLKVHRDDDRSRAGILKAARTHLGAGAVLWVSERGPAATQADGDPVVGAGEWDALVDVLVRAAAGGKPTAPIVLDDDRAAWAGRLPGVRNLLAVPVTDGRPVGWVVAVNKCDPARGTAARFRRADATALLPFAALIELQLRGSRRFGEMKDLLVGLTRSLTAAIDAKDSYTFGHSERVARVAVELGRGLGLPADELSDIYLAGLLHDVGKIGIRDSVLLKAGPLTPDEFIHIQQHPVIGFQILADLRPLHALLPGVRNHHERWDGGGYPDGLRGESIPLLARILAVADAYDAMSTRRPYRSALTAAAVDAQFRAGSGSQWDAGVVGAFFRCREAVEQVRQRGVGKSLGQALDGVLRATAGGSSRVIVAPPRAAFAEADGVAASV